jgi:hypothetical protein
MLQDEAAEMHQRLVALIRHEPALPLSIERFYALLCARVDGWWERFLLTRLALDMGVIQAVRCMVLGAMVGAV